MRAVSAAGVFVLGPIAVVADDGATSLPAKHGRLLAALVIADGHALGVDELVDAVWDGTAPTSARKLVQVYVSQLRKVLPTGCAIVTRGSAYAIELTTDSLDAERFERLVDEAREALRLGNAALALSLADRALALWRGRAYGELAYEDFARAESERLEELRLAAVEELLAAQLQLGRYDDVLGEALAHAEENALRERAHELAMLALYRSGRQADALEHYAVFRARLDEELGLEPGQTLRDLQRLILQQDPTLDVAAGAAASVALPTPPNTLVGRERELEALRALLDRRESRLIVLTGAGGSGKTRLALEVARQVAGSYANGVVLVELAPLRDPALVVPTVAQALDVALAPDEDPARSIAKALAAQELLVLVDNAEHVRAATPSLALLIARAPRVTVLVTSRAVLHVSGEHVFPVSPLGEDDAVELFAQRARALDPAFELGPENESDVREICRRVDGLPLAVELAAARIRTLTPRALLERLEARLGILTGGQRDLPARQQTLRETIDWSVGLLDERSRGVLSRLAVFPGGASLGAAEVVAGASIDTLGSLVDDHLIQRVDIAGDPRYDLLETVREYALELLGDERAQVELVLAEYFAQVVDDLRLSEGARLEWTRALERLEPEIENARAALAAAVASGDAELLVRLAGGLWRYWWVRGFVGEGLAWIERALAAGEGPASVARARALYGGAVLAWDHGDLVQAKRLAAKAISVAVEADSDWYQLAAQSVLGNVAQSDGDLAMARFHYERALELKERLGLEPHVEKYNLGAVALESGEYAEAMALFDDVLDTYQRSGDRVGIGNVLLNTGRVYHELGELDLSRHDFEAARACFEELGFRSQVAYALQGLAAAEAREAHFEEAARLLGQARRELDDAGSSENRSNPAMVAWTKEQARAGLGDDAFEAAYSAGRVAPPNSVS
jgi:predicted ATPase/DNA-binding SARP family transcriptional activator/Tfp pilus assembly protein PilF